jgi:hypothetical protein
LEGLKDEIE